ncbi:MAG TPA: DUF86 domain-containing protein, partial [Anaerolinea sp.]|nr:DUF86 domain-containing protein [Anaerolinea sp.]
EAASRLPVEFKNSHRDVIWEDIVGFRNIAVHEYFAILWEIVWNTAVRDIPDLIKRIRTIINDEYSDG